MYEAPKSSSASEDTVWPKSPHPREVASPDSANPTIKATDPEGKKAGRPEQGKEGGDGRTWGNHPSDPNRMGANVTMPPGVDPEDVRDPGRQTPGAPPVDNRSGQSNA